VPRLRRTTQTIASQTALVAAMMICVVAGGCSELGLPAHGAVTEYIFGTSDFGSDAPPPAATADAALIRDTPAIPARQDTCVENARERSNDVLDQGFDEDLAKHVYDVALAECRSLRR